MKNIIEDSPSKSDHSPSYSFFKSLSLKNVAMSNFMILKWIFIYDIILKYKPCKLVNLP